MTPKLGIPTKATKRMIITLPTPTPSPNSICHRSSQYILAHKASFLEPVLAKALANLQFEGEYMIQVGFNETSLQEGMLVEEIYLLLDGELQSSEDHICATLRAVFAPFPGIVYTRLQTYYVPIDPPPQGSIYLPLELGGKALAVQNIGNASGSGGAGSASTPQSEGTGHVNQKQSSGQNTQKQGRQKEGAMNQVAGAIALATTMTTASKEVPPGLLTFPCTSLSIKGIDSSQKVTAAASIEIKVRFFSRPKVVREPITLSPCPVGPRKSRLQPR